MHICVMSESFPTRNSIDYVFVEQLCRELADLGVKVTVVSPQSLVHCLFSKIAVTKTRYTIKTDKGNTFEVIRPKHLTFGLRFPKFNSRSTFRARKRGMNMIKDPIDVYYGHFWSCAIGLMPYAKQAGKPLFSVAGEGVLKTHLYMNQEQIKAVRECVNGVICVSSKSMHESIDAHFATREMCEVIPNSINPNLFRKMNKTLMRQKYGFNQEDFIIAFVGQFVERKGILRLNQALKEIDDKRIKAMFIGRGEQQPDYEGTILKGTVLHDQLPEYLNCADVFVLPTDNEGCCNAIVEAMACGLPIISSDMEFNHDILNEDNSIMVNPYDVSGIKDAIMKLYHDRDMCAKLSEGALISAESLTITRRAEKILYFIKNRI